MLKLLFLELRNCIELVSTNSIYSNFRLAKEKQEQEWISL